MDWLQLVVLALIQGISEFLPISSSAHLILVPVVTGWPDQGLAFDVAVHLGTLAAVMVYFRRSLAEIAGDVLQVRQRGFDAPAIRLGLAIIVATLPAVVVGVLFKEAIETVLRSPLVIATTTVVFGLLLAVADHFGRRREILEPRGEQRGEYQVGLGAALFIGCAQALALIPGTSRSGVTLTAGLALGLSRTAAARFSLLLAIPLILAATGLLILDLIATGQAVPWGDLALAAVLAGLSAYTCIHFLLRLIERVGVMPFVIYRLVLGGVLFAVYG
ncbi:MAG: undecaprenyl-diphosphate phosphatase [Candidatus Competibacterales bacterium]